MPGSAGGEVRVRSLLVSVQSCLLPTAAHSVQWELCLLLSLLDLRVKVASRLGFLELCAYLWIGHKKRSTYVLTVL